MRALSRAGRVAATGVAASALLAVALGVLLPRIFEAHALGARLDAASALVRILEREGLVPPVGDHLVGEDYERFDAVVRDGLLGGENVRVKLWSLLGEIVYSDEIRLVGRRFSVGPDLRAALEGTPAAEITDLSDPENRYERHLGPEALELYVPLRDDRGVVGAFEIYQDAEPLAAHLVWVRRAVWIAVGSGLSVLLLFLVLLFGATARIMERERRAAEGSAEDLAVLLRTSRVLTSDPGLERTGSTAMRIVSDRLRLRCAAVAIDGDGDVTCASSGEPRVCAVASDAAARAVREGDEVVRHATGDAQLGHAPPSARCVILSSPVRSAERLVGALVVCRDRSEPFDARERDLVAGVSGQLGMAVESGRLFSGLREMTAARGRLLRRLVNAQEEERRRLVGDLHDGLGQTLTRILYGLRGSRARLPAGDVERELAHLESLVEEQSRGLRRHMATIRPTLLEDFGLAAAVRAFAREQEQESGLRVSVRVGDLPEMEPAAGIVLFRAAQEAVMNARKHAGARRLWLSIDRDATSLVLRVRDDGVGAEAIREGTGLAAMRDRVASLDGDVDVESAPGRGTAVTVRVPVEREHGSDPRPGR